MPNGRKKVPFSSKQKKVQLQNRRDRKKSSLSAEYSTNENQGWKRRGNKPTVSNNLQSQGSNPTSRYRLMLPTSQNNTVTMRSYISKKIQKLPENVLESTIDKTCESNLWLPIRPSWKHNMSKKQLDSNEYNYFKEFTESLDAETEGEICCYEHNLETWRQLWRVLEMSDVILLTVDIRHPVFNFPPSLYRYVCKDLQKNLVLILNKTDLVPKSVVSAWENYFINAYPDLKIVCFCSLPRRPKNKAENHSLKMSIVAENVKKLFCVIQEIVGNNVNIDSWKQKIEEDFVDSKIELKRSEVQVGKLDDSFLTTSFKYKKFSNGIVTIGCVGCPNVGKSSLLNTLMGRKVVSVSRTPGHTKYFQTIFLTSSVKICDCPGLVFPSRLEQCQQVLTGCRPISQLRNPLPSIEYLAERIDLWKSLKLRPDGDINNGYTALDICDAWATKKGYYTAKAARPDTYRAANHILRLALNGEICLFFYPPNYFGNRECYENGDDHHDSNNSNSSDDESEVEDYGSFAEDSDSDSESVSESNESNKEEEETDECLLSSSKNMYAALDCGICA